MKPIELEIKTTVEDRLDVARILIKNGYRVCVESRKGTGSSKTTVLLIDRRERGAE